MTALLLVHAAATLFMCGLIWFVQIVHYPGFATVGRAEFTAYEAAHTRRTGWVVTAPMLIELATALALVVRPPAALPTASVWLGLGLVAVLWLSTGLLQMPAHRRLLTGFDARVAARLVRTNWLRTGAWTARGVLALWMLSAV
ncbi:MAG: hypothetical protein ACYTEZ_18450 [Planctomycetota bacterium]|jgi:hypothetical protein